MKTTKLAVLSLAIIGLLAVAFVVIRAVSNHKGEEVRRADAVLTATPADRQIRAAEVVIDRAPLDPKGHNLLAAAYMQKARESEDYGVNAKAAEALEHSLKIAPDNYDALKLRAKLLLTYHRFEEALETARRVEGMNPRDHDNHGAMTDAHVELGDYPAAVEAAQKMVDLRPETSSYARVSYLRWLHGDIKGAIEAMKIAAQSASPQDPERMAWCHVQIGEALLGSGQAAEAVREFDRALFFFPAYGAALSAKARARIALGDLEGAVEIYRSEYERGASADTALALGDLYTRLGRSEEASKHYAAFESLERENAAAENDMHHLVVYWTDHDKNLDEALALAKKERERRKDIFTCDNLAWALFKKGQLDEAKAMMGEALRLGTRDARLLYHAGMISVALGDREGGLKYLRDAIAMNPSFDVLQAEIARRTLAARSSPASRSALSP